MTGMSLLRPQIFVSSRVFTRIAHGMAVRKQIDPEPAVAVLPPDIQTVYNQPKRPLPKPAIDLLVSKTTVDDWQMMGPCGRIGAYLQLSKHRLTMLVTMTAMSGALMVPVELNASTILACAVGTTLMSASANSLNQYLEIPYDAQMKRTQSRVLVIHRLSPLDAIIFASGSALVGGAILYSGCNLLTASLGLLNIFLYSGVYTPMKRYHVGCTWVGALVGAIPPLMGYAALTGSLDARALVLAAILFSWQFPHFNGLSWNLRGDYSRAGYHVMCVKDEGLCRRTTLRHALFLLGFCSIAAPLSHLTTSTFALSSLPVNAAFIYLSYKFYKQPDAKTSRNLFRYSLIYLPLIMILMAISQYEAVETHSQVPKPIAHTSV
ncbi:Heme O synthase [Aphelenchoides bicaudatus]|nr:Heme O synthase [Aphelenchoides bicaudatus]